MDKILVASADLDWNDVAGNSSGEGDLARDADGAILGHEERASAGDTCDGAEEATAASVLGMGRHLDGGGHPGEFACFGDDGVIGGKGEFQHRHRRAEDAVLHNVS